MTTIGRSDLDVSGLCLGASVFGWTADEPTSFALLDAFLDAGGTMLDSSDSYTVDTGNLSCFPCFSLAKGFLTGKYRPDSTDVDSGATSGAMHWARAEGARSYLDDRGVREQLEAILPSMNLKPAPDELTALSDLSAR